jgi:hypothetical protein
MVLGCEDVGEGLHLLVRAQGERGGKGEEEGEEEVIY